MVKNFEPISDEELRESLYGRTGIGTELSRQVGIQGAPNKKISEVRARGAVSDVHHLTQMGNDVEAILAPEEEIGRNEELLGYAAAEYGVDVLAAEDYSDRDRFETAFDDVMAQIQHAEEKGVERLSHHTSDAHARAVLSAYETAIYEEDLDIDARVYGHGHDGSEQHLKQVVNSFLQTSPVGRSIARKF